MPKRGKLKFSGGKYPRKPRNLSQKTRKGRILKKLVPKLKKLELNSTNSKPNCKKMHLDCTRKPNLSVSYGLKVKNKTIRVLFDSESSGGHFLVKKGTIKHISVVRRDIPQSWGTSNGTFDTDKLGDIEILFVEYSTSKKVCLQLDIVDYFPREEAPMYDFIIGKQTLHDLGLVSDFKEKKKNEICLLTRNVTNLQFKPNITRALRHNTCLAQEPINTHNATKRVVKILDTKY